MTDQPQALAEFSRPLALDAVGQEELVMEISAIEEERAALVRRFGLLALSLLKAELRLRRREESGFLLVEGRIEAEVTQACVVTLEPVTSRLAEPVEWRYSLEPAVIDGCTGGTPGVSDVEIEVEEIDPPEPVGPEGVDLGEAVAQQFSVVLEPYPRAKGASVAQLDWTGADLPEKPDGPFAVLESLRRKQ